MPHYEVTHVCDLSEQQQDKLAEKITQIHIEKFNVPSLIVNVTIKPAPTNAYIGGKRRRSNMVVGRLRTSDSRSKADYQDVVSQILKAWEELIGNEGDRNLRLVSIVGGIVTSHESGFWVPIAGEEPVWIKDNFQSFQRRADNGDQEMKDLMHELSTRECFKNLLPVSQ